MSDGHLHNRVSIYVKDPALYEMRKLAERYNIPLSRVLTDSWKIAQSCKCKVPQGVIIFGDKRGMKQSGS